MFGHRPLLYRPGRSGHSNRFPFTRSASYSSTAQLPLWGEVDPPSQENDDPVCASVPMPLIFGSSNLMSYSSLIRPLLRVPSRILLRIQSQLQRRDPNFILHARIMAW